MRTTMVLVWLQVQHDERSTGKPIEKSRYHDVLLRTATTEEENSQNGRPARVPAEGCDAVLERVASGHACTVRPLTACL